jgi:hypothetical protein
MSGTLKTSYRGWSIDVRCLQKQALNVGPRERRSFTATGHAVLHGEHDRREWVDSRPQIVTLGDRIFDTASVCSDVLLAEIKVLIDALKK